MTNKATKISLVAVFAIFALQAVFVIMPVNMLHHHDLFIQPVVAVALVLITFWQLGFDKRKLRTAYQSNVAAVIAVVMYTSMIMSMAFLFGGGRNIMTINPQLVLSNIWTMAIPLVLFESVRHRLIKAMGDKGSVFILVLITLIFALMQIRGMRAFILGGGSGLRVFIFEGLLPSLTASAVVTLAAMRGTFTAAVVISFVLNLGGVFFPILPDFDSLVWALVNCAVFFFIGLILHRLTDTRGHVERKRIAKAAKQSRGPISKIVSLGTTALIIAFFLQWLPIYPVVILTTSMTGTIDRGSLVIMQRIPADRVFERVEIQDILHYRYRNVEFVHRVIDFRYNDAGVREFITKGDANDIPDLSPLPQQDVLGTPLFHFPFIGYPNVFFRSMFGGF